MKSEKNERNVPAQSGTAGMLLILIDPILVSRCCESRQPEHFEKRF